MAGGAEIPHIAAPPTFAQNSNFVSAAQVICIALTQTLWDGDRFTVSPLNEGGAGFSGQLVWVWSRPADSQRIIDPANISACGRQYSQRLGKGGRT